MRQILMILLAMLHLPVFAVEFKVSFITPSIVRVCRSGNSLSVDNGTGVCLYTPMDVNVSVKREAGKITYISDELLVEVDADNKAIVFRDKKNGKLLLAENPSEPYGYESVVKERIVYDDSSAHMEETANGKVTVKDVLYRDTVGITMKHWANFMFAADEALYGLGSHMEDYMNLLGKTLYLTQHNLKAFVPMLSSIKGYGLLFDAGCSMKFSSKECGGQYTGTMELEAAKMLDYYFIKGEKLDEVVAGYRFLTGNVSMMPRYLFGYIQSKERYVSSDDIIATVKEYRRRHVPLDMIVQDWNYWPEGWGYMKMNRKFYPDPKALADSVHAMNAHIMVSIWPNPQYCPQERDFRDKGFMLEHSVYDVFNTEARKYYWSYADKEFFSNGFDAWWCDSSEPLDGDWNRIPEPDNGIPYSWESHERRWRLNDEILSDALGAERSCLYSLYHSKGIYENQRQMSDKKRVVNLTRSTFAGQQRYGTIVWNGDTHASWKSFKQQIPSGLNYMSTGNPYWTVDVGSFFVRSTPQWFCKGEFPQGVASDEYKEFYTRMFQWATFLPVLRSHGTDTPREIWQFGEPGTQYYDAILKMINLRYSFLPYIYSMAAAQSFGYYTMARLLAFDFPEDTNVLDLKDQYMFGDILVCPVTDAGVISRSVYLPDTDTPWIDFWTGASYNGGCSITAEAPVDRLPLFVRGGSILVSSEPAEYSGAQMGKPVTISIYPGKNAEFEYYDDDGDGYGFEGGNSCRIHLAWNEKKHTLTISDIKGCFGNGQSAREFVVKAFGYEKKVVYSGKSMKVRLKK